MEVAGISWGVYVFPEQFKFSLCPICGNQIEESKRLGEDKKPSNMFKKIFDGGGKFSFSSEQVEKLFGGLRFNGSQPKPHSVNTYFLSAGLILIFLR